MALELPQSKDARNTKYNIGDMNASIRNIKKSQMTFLCDNLNLSQKKVVTAGNLSPVEIKHSEPVFTSQPNPNEHNVC